MTLYNNIAWEQLTITLILCSFSPFFASIVLAILLTQKKYLDGESADTSILAGSLCFVIAVSAINTVKIPESDLFDYIASYKSSKNYSFEKYLYIGSNAITYFKQGSTIKEPVYASLVWILNRLFDSNVPLFKFTLSFINYALLTKAVCILGKKMKLEPCITITGLCLMCFIPYIFTMSLQLCRQFLAGSVLVYIIVLKCFTDTKAIHLVILSAMMVLTHSTSFIFLPFIFLPALNRSFNDAWIWYLGILVGLFGIRFLAGHLHEYIGNGSSSISYALYRASAKTAFDLGEMSFLTIALIAAIIVSAFFFGHLLYFEEKVEVKRFFNLMLFLGIFILLNINQSELSARMCFYLYPFVPFLLIFFVEYFCLSKISLTTLCMLSIVGFVFYIKHGAWTYNIPLNFLGAPLLLYFQ